MLTVKPAIVHYDSLTISLWLTCWHLELLLKEVHVVDRWGLPVHRVEPASACASIETYLADIPRARFPLFIVAVDGQGTRIPPENVGPIFPAPTDPEYGGGFALPAPAIDLENDRQLRVELAEFRVLDHRQRELRGRIDGALAARAAAAQHTRSSALMALLFPAVALASHAGLPQWILITMLAIGVLAAIPVMLHWAAGRKLRAEYRALADSVERAFADADEVRQRLRRWGVDADRALDKPCTCREGSRNTA